MKKEEKQVMIDDLSKRLDENNIIYIQQKLITLMKLLDKIYKVKS